MTILLVDDDPREVARLRRILEPMGHETLSCGTGREALDLAQRLRPDMAIIDTELPDIPGQLVHRYLRLNPETRWIHIILANPHPVDEDVFFGFSHYSDAHIERPLEKAWLTEWTSRLGNWSRLDRPDRDPTCWDRQWDLEWERLGRPLQPCPEDEIAARFLQRKGLPLLGE